MQGQLLDGRYEIEQILGAGDFGQTFIAKDRKMFDAICVVKLLKPASNDDRTLALARQMFAAWLTDKSQLISKKKLTQTGLERKRGVNCF